MQNHVGSVSIDQSAYILWTYMTPMFKS